MKKTTCLLALLGLSLMVNAMQDARTQRLLGEMGARHQRETADLIASMADIEVNLEKLLIASGAKQSAKLLGETALLSQHVESSLSRLPLSGDAVSGAMKFAGQMREYTMGLVPVVSAGGALTEEDERQLGRMLDTCRELNANLSDAQGIAPPEGTAPFLLTPDWEDENAAGTIEYPSLIYDGPFSDGRTEGAARGLTGERITRRQALEAAARYAGTTDARVREAADSGGRFEAFGFTADTEDGAIYVQVTGQGGHLLWMMPERAEYPARVPQEECLKRARVWLEEMGFGEMEVCFVQQYDGMTVANFAAVQEGALLYPDQVKVQISMESGRVVGAECSQYLMNHARRETLKPAISQDEARRALSGKLTVLSARLCVIPEEAEERLCWGFKGVFGEATYWVFVDATTGETAEILRLAQTEDGETAI